MHEVSIRANLLKSKPGSNGYDLVCLHPIPFVAEVKCNIPINGGSKYGSAQRTGILKDVASLKAGKIKAAQLSPGTLKFMVFLDLPQVKAANAHLVASSPGLGADLRFLRDDETPRDAEIVYGVRTNLEQPCARSRKEAHFFGAYGTVNRIGVEQPRGTERSMDATP